MSEDWASNSYFPYHEISTLGRVRVKKRVGSHSAPVGTILRGTTGTKGYRQVRIKDASGQTLLWRIHRLVLETFIGAAPSSKHQAAHHDGDPANNALSNLRWATPAENQADRVRHNTSNRGENNPNFKHGRYSGSKGYIEPKCSIAGYAKLIEERCPK